MSIVLFEKMCSLKLLAFAGILCSGIVLAEDYKATLVSKTTTLATKYLQNTQIDSVHFFEIL